MHPPLLTSGVALSAWGDLAVRARATLEDPLVDELVLTHDAADVSVAMQRVVVDDYPVFVGWLIVDHPDLAQLCRARHWHVWPREHPCDWAAPGQDSRVRTGAQDCRSTSSVGSETCVWPGERPSTRSMSMRTAW